MPISESDRAKIDELREKVKDQLTPYYDTDFNLLRWLKGHDYNLDVIVPKLVNHLKFRRSDWSLDTVADGPRNHPIHNHWKSGLTGEAVHTPFTIVNIEQSGGNDYWGMQKSYPINEVLRARLHDLESMLRAVMKMEEKTGEQCSVLYIMDLSGLVMDRRTIPLLTGGLASISAFMAEHYVEMVHSFVLVNVPSFISAVWTVAKPLLPERTRQKVNILGGNWREEVQKLADVTTLPSYWNEEGQTTPFLAPVERGDVFPESNYYQGGVATGAQSLSVAAGKAGWLDIDAKQGNKLKWEIHANGHFAFCVFHVANKDDDVTNMERAYPMFSKVPGPTMVPCLDELVCNQSGTYRFWFGNQHAWFHTLKVQHHISIE